MEVFMDFNHVADMLVCNDFDVYVYDTAAQAVKKILEIIPQDAVVGWGGSVSCMESGLIDAVRKNFKVLDREPLKGEERTQLMRRILSEADVFLTSFNAVSEDGHAVNIDGNGNRVAAISFGPKMVIALVGKNKICRTLSDAYERASTIAAGKNAVRFGKKEEERDSLINIIQVLKRGGHGRIKVFLVNEDLGY